jgi:hypothetical protein
MGPYVSGVFDPLGWAGANPEITDEITLEVTRVIIAISVFAVGVELPKVSMQVAYDMNNRAHDRRTCGSIGGRCCSCSAPV